MARQWISFDDLEAHHCKFPRGEGGKKSPFRFCGKERLGKSPYCFEHGMLCSNGKPGRAYYLLKAEQKEAA